MSPTSLWAVTNQGKVFTLSTTGQQWEELIYCGMEFKRVSAVNWCSWGIGGDHQMYVYIFGLDVPIRVVEVAYENQRWNPKEGFSDRLLPTDRPAWSSEDGLESRFREHIKLPTLSWQWEGDWKVEHNFDGQLCDPEGWVYAIDFPATYTNQKSWLSYVRRRKWTRQRRYVSTNCWANVPSIHKDPVYEPFIDVAVGGQDVPGGNEDASAVWAVTVFGRAMFRVGVGTNCPEGETWMHVPTVQGEVNQLSVGPTGLVWAVSWTGRALVRLGVTRNDMVGSGWAEVLPPSESSKLQHVSVGVNAVWAITRDNKVWFRKGIRGTESGISEAWAVGSGWVEMVGEMSLLSVGPNDQVWALSSDERKLLFFRMAVTPQDLSGKTWKPIVLPCHGRIENEDCFVEDYGSLKDSFPEVRRTSENGGSAAIELPSVPNMTIDIVSKSGSDGKDGQDDEEDHSMTCDDSSCQLTTLVENEDSTSFADQLFLHDSQSLQIDFGAGEVPSGNSGEERKSDSSPSSYPGIPRLHSRPPPSLSFFHGDSVASTDDTGYYDEGCAASSWTWVSSGGCIVDGCNPPNWFRSALGSQQSVVNEQWYKEIVSCLGSRHDREMEKFASYERAIDNASWTTTGKGQILVEAKHAQWFDCKLELEKIGTINRVESATLFCFGQGPTSVWQKLVLDLQYVTCIMRIASPLKVALAIHCAPDVKPNTITRLAFISDTDLEEWLSLLSTTCCEIRGVRGAALTNAMWALTTQGDIFVHDAPENKVALSPSEMFWHQFGGHLRTVECCPAGVVWGLGYNHQVWVYTGGWGGGFFKGMDSSGSDVHPMTDVRCLYIYENQRWNPVTGFSNRRLPTDRYVWSDKTGRHECTRENTKLPSMHWQWVTDWMIDYNNSGGVDRDGWQYAKDFPASYHGYKGMTDYVRRRRWVRKCRLSTTGPWEAVESVRLVDLSFQVDDTDGDAPIRLWAVSIKGEVLCRLGVTRSCPKGVSWEHVPLEQPARAVSVGGGTGSAWVVTRTGSVFLRHGISDQQPTGRVWFSVTPPEQVTSMKQISTGPTAVWALDSSGQPWVRQEIVPVYPEGTSWKPAGATLRHVSLGPGDQVWGITETSGLLCRRLGNTSGGEMGDAWQYNIGGGWQHVSARGYILATDGNA